MSELITERWALEDDLIEIHEDEEDRIRALLLGHKVEKIADDHIRLDDGTVVRIVPNEGGCACSAGDYVLSDLNEVDNIITSVEMLDEAVPDPDYPDFYPTERVYRVFVVAADKKINLFTVEGDDGNGFYGTGYVLLVRKP